MWGYYFSRSSVITFLVIMIWLIANIFVNVPPNFSSKEGDVINKTLVHKEECNSSRNHYHYFYDFTYITDNGKTVTVKNEEFRDNGEAYEKFIESNEYYTTNGWFIVIFIILCIYGVVGFLLTIVMDGFNDLSEFVSGYENRVKAREMRINHFRILCNFIGYNDQQDYEDTMKAIEMYRNNEDDQDKIKYHCSFNIPTWEVMFNETRKYYNNIVKERNKSNKEENETERKHGGFCD